MSRTPLADSPSEEQQREIALAERIRNGDHAAFEHMFRCHYERLCRYATRYVGSVDGAEDVVQALFFQIWESRATWHPRDIRSYLFAAVRNRSIRAAQRNSRMEYDHFPAASARSDASIKEKDVAHLIERAMARLSPRQREVFYLSRNVGLSHREIALVMQVSVHTVENHMARALEKLRDNLYAHLER